MLPSEVEKIFRAFAEKRKAELPRFTPDGIPITLENKFDAAIYNYLYAYWKKQSGEYDPKDDEIIMTKESSFTKNEKKFEQWLLQQYGMTNKEQREYTVKGNLLSLGEIALSAWGIEGAGATKLVVPGKFLASNADDTAKKALQQDTIGDAVEGTLKKEVAENTVKKEIADTAEDLSQKTVRKDDVLEDSSVVKGNNGTNRGTLTGKLDGLKQDEKNMVEDLLNSGKNVEIIPRSNIPNEKTPDFLVDGVKTELKTLNGTSLNTPVTRIQDGFEQGAQTVIIDGRKTGLTLEQANTVINRALGKYGGNLPGKIEIWTNEGIIRR